MCPGDYKLTSTLREKSPVALNFPHHITTVNKNNMDLSSVLKFEGFLADNFSLTCASLREESFSANHLDSTLGVTTFLLPHLIVEKNSTTCIESEGIGYIDDSYKTLSGAMLDSSLVNKIISYN